jgi:hypothetical protein
MERSQIFSRRSAVLLWQHVLRPQDEKGWIRMIFLVLILFIVIYVATVPSESNTTTHASVTSSHIVADYEAHLIAERFIKERLKAPSTADFPWGTYRANHLPNDSWIVSSYVDAQNSFGAKLRSNWVCELKYNGRGELADPGNWTLTGFCGLIE